MVQIIDAGFKLKSLLLDLSISKQNQSLVISEDYHSRHLVVTHFDGAYGKAGSVIALNGSPPRGVLLCLMNDHHTYDDTSIVYITQTKSKRMSFRQSRTVVEFLDTLKEESK